MVVVFFPPSSPRAIGIRRFEKAGLGFEFLSLCVVVQTESSRDVTQRLQASWLELYDLLLFLFTTVTRFEHTETHKARDKFPTVGREDYERKCRAEWNGSALACDDRDGRCVVAAVRSERPGCSILKTWYTFDF